MWIAGRRVPSAVLIRAQSALHVTASGPPSSTGRACLLRLEREPDRADDVVDPDRLHALGPGPDHRRHGRESRDAQEARQGAAVGAEDEARSQDDVLDAARRDRLLGRPLRPEVRHGRAWPRCRARSSGRSGEHPSRARPRRGCPCPPPSRARTSPGRLRRSRRGGRSSAPRARRRAARRGRSRRRARARSRRPRAPLRRARRAPSRAPACRSPPGRASRAARRSRSPR